MTRCQDIEQAPEERMPEIWRKAASTGSIWANSGIAFSGQDFYTLATIFPACFQAVSFKGATCALV